MKSHKFIFVAHCQLGTLNQNQQKEYYLNYRIHHKLWSQYHIFLNVERFDSNCVQNEAISEKLKRRDKVDLVIFSMDVRLRFSIYHFEPEYG